MDRYRIRTGTAWLRSVVADDLALSIALNRPKFGHHGARPYIGSAAVLTIKCAACDHGWSVEMNSLAADIREQVKATLEVTPPTHG